MKPHTKFLSALLTLLLLGSSLSACAEQKPEESETVSPETETAAAESDAETESAFIPDDLPDANFNGYEYRILSANFYKRDSAHLIMFEEITGDPVNDELFASKCAVEDRFNTKMSMVDGLTTEGAKTIFRTSVNGGDHSFDIFVAHDGDSAGLSKEGLCLNLLNIPQFNTEKPWWPKNAVEQLSIGDKMYLASSYLSYLGLHWTRAIMVNKDYAADINMEIPYDLVREGKWTLDALQERISGVSQDVDGNGKIDRHDKIGFTSGGQTWYCMQQSVDLPIYRRDEAGYPVLDLDIERAQAYVERMDGLLNGGDYIADGDFGVDVFRQGTALFAFSQIGDAYDYYRISDVKYGFLPSPKLDETQENYINCCTDMPWCFPKTLYGDDVNTVGTITEALSCQNYNRVLPAYFEGAIKARIADAPDDSEMIQLIADTRTISFGFTYFLPCNNVVNDCVLGNSPVSSYFKRNGKMAARQLERMLKMFDDIE